MEGERLEARRARIEAYCFAKGVAASKCRARRVSLLNPTFCLPLTRRYMLIVCLRSLFRALSRSTVSRILSGVFPLTVPTCRTLLTLYLQLLTV